MFERLSLVAVTSPDLAKSREFWVDIFGCSIVEEQAGRCFVVDLAGLQLRVVAGDGTDRVAGGLDPTLRLKVASVQDAIDALNEAGLEQYPPIEREPRGAYAVVRDPQGRAVILAEGD